MELSLNNIVPSPDEVRTQCSLVQTFFGENDFSSRTIFSTSFLFPLSMVYNTMSTAHVTRRRIIISAKILERLVFEAWFICTSSTITGEYGPLLFSTPSSSLFKLYRLSFISRPLKWMSKYEKSV